MWVGEHLGGVVQHVELLSGDAHEAQRQVLIATVGSQHPARNRVRVVPALRRPYGVGNILKRAKSLASVERRRQLGLVVVLPNGKGEEQLLDLAERCRKFVSEVRND